VVSRVSSDVPTNLGSDITGQVGAQPRALIVGAAILFGFALIPGMPMVTFIVLGLGLGAIGYWRVRSDRAKAAEEEQSSRGPSPLSPAVSPGGKKKKPASGADKEEFAITVPRLVDVPACRSL
jgi:type III secretion protein V